MRDQAAVLDSVKKENFEKGPEKKNIKGKRI